MATQEFSLSETWADITTLGSLVLDQAYLVQNIGQVNIHLFESPSLPGASVNGVYLRQGEGSSSILRFLQLSDTLYARSFVGEGILILTEST